MAQIDKFIPHITFTTENKNWFSFISNIHRTPLFRQLFLSMAIIGLYTFGLVYFLIHVMEAEKISPTIHQILGITLGLLLVIRTNTAYDRWWEGRKAVGTLNNSCRNFAIKINAFLPPEEKRLRRSIANALSAYCFAFKEHLRKGVKFEELHDIEDPLVLEEFKKAYHVPNRIAKYIYEKVVKIRNANMITDEQFIILDKDMENWTNMVGACERIKRTPQPKAYSMHLKFFIFVYVITLPIGLFKEFQYWTVPATMLVFYAMVGMELIGEEIEDPFGTDENDIPMDTICNAIRHNVFEILCPEITGAKTL